MATHPSVARLLAAAIKATASSRSPVTDYQSLREALGGISAATMTNWKSRGVPRRYALEAERLFGVPARHILDGVVEATPGTATASGKTAVVIVGNPEYPAIRRVKFKLSAGASGFSVDFLDEDDLPIVFRKEWFEANGYRPEQLFAVRVANVSMQPGLWEGDTVVVNTADTKPRDGEVFAANFEGELVIKRLLRDESRWWLKSDNPDQTRYPRKACTDDVFLLGRIVHKQSEHI
jgi:phage repressor protein C with HTH and peptisase S24 domain